MQRNTQFIHGNSIFLQTVPRYLLFTNFWEKEMHLDTSESEDGLLFVLRLLFVVSKGTLCHSLHRC